MKKIFLTALLLLTMTFTACGGQSDDIRGKTFVVGIDDEFAPMTFRDENNRLVGFDFDLANEVAARLGVTFKFKPIEWDNKEFEITSGNVDLIWSGLDVTDERKSYMIFSNPYMDNRQIIFVRADSEDEIRSEDDLAGKIVGTQSGSNSETYINDNIAVKNSFMKFQTYTNFTEGFGFLSRGEVDALIVDEIAARYEMKKNPDAFKIVDVTIGPVTGFGIGFGKDNVNLRDKVQATFATLVDDGTAQKISEQWFNANLISFKK